MPRKYRIVYTKPGRQEVKEATHVKAFTNRPEADDELARLIVQHPRWTFWIQVED